MSNIFKAFTAKRDYVDVLVLVKDGLHYGFNMQIFMDRGFTKEEFARHILSANPSLRGFCYSSNPNIYKDMVEFTF